MKKYYLYPALIIFLMFLSLSTTNNVNAQTLGAKLSGKILLQVQKNGEAWYVFPNDQKKYYLGRPSDAFDIMRKLSLGVSNRDFDTFRFGVPARLSGKIILKVEDEGQAYYIDTIRRQMHYLGRPDDAFAIMKNLGLGISNSDLAKIVSGNISIALTTKPITLPSQNIEKTTTGNPDAYLAALETKAFEMINDYRISTGLPKLTWHNDIAKAARSHSLNMATGKAPFGHDGFNDRITEIQQTISLRSAAENVAYNYGYKDPSDNAVNGWLDSPGHYKNIIGDYSKTGLGVAKSKDGSYYFTQIFIK